MRILRFRVIFQPILLLLILSAGFPSILNSQELKSGNVIEATLKPDPNREKTVAASSEAMMESPDTNFTFEKYGEFLKKISDTSRYLVLPIDEFRKTIDTNKIIFGLRHDVDNDLKVARAFSKTEKDLGFRSTYYILHIADYYLANPSNKAVHTDSIIPILKDLQNNSHFEIGWHNDLVTLQVVYHIDPVAFLKNELAWLRGNGIKITGSASHGSSYCRVYNYLNFYFFEECTWPIVGQFVNNVTVPDGPTSITLKKGKFSDFGLEYEAYFLNNNKYYSDASFVNGRRWDIGMLDLSSLKKGDRVIILLHPIHWHSASTRADINSFFVPGQESGYINPSTSTVNILMPYGTSLKGLVPSFSLSPGAYAKVNGSVQLSNISEIDGDTTVIFKVYAENRTVTKNWLVKISNAKNKATSIESFSFPGLTKKVIINPDLKTITAKVYSSALLGSMTPVFRLSAGATAYIGAVAQTSNLTSNDFSGPVTYRILAENGITSTYWRVNVEVLNDKADLLSFVIPGMIRSESIDPVTRRIEIEVLDNQILTSIPAMFSHSDKARVYVGEVEQISGLSLNDYTNELMYKVISEDSLTINTWTVSVKHQTLSDSRSGGDMGPTLRVYPNPAKSKALLLLSNITDKESKIEIFNSQGILMYTNTFVNVSYVSEEINLTGFTPGIYIIRSSSVKKPVRFIIN